MKLKMKLYLALIASVLIGSFTPVVLTFSSGTNSIEIFLLASIISIPIGLILLLRKNNLRKLKTTISDKNQFFYLILTIILLYLAVGYGTAYSESLTGVSLTIIIFRTSPLLMLLFIPIFLRERMTIKQVFALIIGFFGIAIAITHGNTLSGPQNLFLILPAIMITLGFTLANLIIKQRMFESEIFVSFATFIMTGFFALLFLFTGYHFSALNFNQIIVAAYIGVSNVVSFYMYLQALKALKTTLVTNTFMFSPFFTMIWSYLFLAESIQIYYIVAAIFISFGILIQQKDALGGSYVTRTKHHHSFTIFDVTGAFSEGNVANINYIINSGGRILSAKIHKSNQSALDEMLELGIYNNVYTSDSPEIRNESSFIRDIVGANLEDIVVLKGGPQNENEIFFEKLHYATEGTTYQKSK